LLERRHTLTGGIAGLDIDVAHLPRRLAAAVDERDAQRRYVADAERRLVSCVRNSSRLDGW
jgi:hypothetical protein